jgi:hypothetical protein
MRLVSPALYYLKYLTCHPDGYGNDVIKERLHDERLDYIDDKYIDKVRASMKVPTPFHPTDDRHKKSFAFINNEGVLRLFRPDESMKTAKKLLELPRAKEFIESMILVHVPLSAIAAYVTEHHRISCTAHALQIYQHYYWNIDLLDTSEMRVLLALRFDQATEREKVLDGKVKLLRSAYYKDPRKVAADLPYSPTSALLAQMRLGVRPGKVDLTMRMMEARDMSIIRAIEAVQQDGPQDNMKFLNYVNGGRILEELLQLVSRPEEHMQDQLRAIALRTETKAVPSIHQLSAGQHTVEMAPIEKDHEGTVVGESSPGPSDLSSGGRTDG